ncbi:hypothetical protein [Paludisphaera soli]|uniref:hypothetical protein n=1 Tax=Paludisphaera soli TaxID=2712865 RepID=UPI0013EBC3C9|nr:hypothetical protein [Paludisphaera soli]
MPARFVHASLLAALILTSVSTPAAGQATPDGPPPARKKTIRTLWTGNPRIKPARFFTLFMYSESFNQGQREDTHKNMTNMFREFNNDVSDLREALGPELIDISRPVRVDSSARAPRPPRSQKDGVDESYVVIKDKRGLRDCIDALKKELEENDPGTDDVVFVYLLTHGGKDQNGRVVLEAGDRDLVDRQNDLVMPLKSLVAVDDGPARLVVLITDNCAGDRLVRGVRPQPAAQPAAAPLLPETSERRVGGIWRALYFGHEGFVDIQSADPNLNQSGYIVGSSGSLFLLAFSSALSANSIDYLLDPDERDRFKSMNNFAKRNRFVEKLDRPDANGLKDGVVAWKDEFRGHLEHEMSRLFDQAFKRNEGQQRQTISFDLSGVKVRPADGGIRN